MPENIKRVIALGFFDGVHMGHAALIRRIKEVSKRIGADPAVLSFDTHPGNIIEGSQTLLINSAAGRADILSRIYGIDKVIFIHFDEKVRRMSWKEFLDSVVDELGAVHLVVGHDFRFGYKGEGNTTLLREYAKERGIGWDIVPKVTMDGETISSTYIRKLIARGDIESANRFLGHPHTLVDTVRYGYKLGRKIGTPTINMRFPEGVLIPAFGVYAAKVILEDGEHMAVTNIGVRPTVSGEKKVTVESYILDFEGNLYGRTVRVEFYRFLRPEMKFESVALLKEQIQRDADSTRKFFENLSVINHAKNSNAPISHR